MARTSGHGNPKWTRDETILALELYLSASDRVPGPADDRVIALSNELRRYPFHVNAARKASFRNPDGVSFKLQNIRQVATGKGLGNTSTMDRLIWSEFGHDQHRVTELALAIRQQAEDFDSTETDGEIEFAEGRLLTRAHKMRERNPNVRKKLLEARRKNGSLSCDVCNLGSPIRSFELSDAIFEVHHNIPISETGPAKTKLSDVSLLCANCHRLLHRMIAKRKRWVGIKELSEIVSNSTM